MALTYRNEYVIVSAQRDLLKTGILKNQTIREIVVGESFVPGKLQMEPRVGFKMKDIDTPSLCQNILRLVEAALIRLLGYAASGWHAYPRHTGLLLRFSRKLLLCTDVVNHCELPGAYATGRITLCFTVVDCCDRSPTTLHFISPIARTKMQNDEIVICEDEKSP